jgi:hypothetical protein
MTTKTNRPRERAAVVRDAAGLVHEYGCRVVFSGACDCIRSPLHTSAYARAEREALDRAGADTGSES